MNRRRLCAKAVIKSSSRNLTVSKEEQAWYVYILCCADQTFYTGCSPDLEARVAAHNAGRAAKYTRGRLPVRLVYQEQHSCRSTAAKREYQIKQLTRQEKISLISSA